MQNDPLVNTKLGAYRIQELLGEGGMARVYRGYDERLRRDVAIKIMLPQRREDMAEFQTRFIQEAQLIAGLQNRNIVIVYEFGETASMVYLVMQYVAGGTLRGQLRDGPLEPRRAALYALQMARALHHAHQHGIVHRDVKPLNMLVSATNRNELLLSDFGIAKLYTDRSEASLPANAASNGSNEQARSLTGGGVMGTPQYMAPEQCTGAPVDTRTDIYALGVVLFEMLCGRTPFQGNVYALSYQHVHDPAPSILSINPTVPPALAQITARALEKDPAARYQTAKEMEQALDAFLRSPAPAPVAPPPAASRRKKRRRTVLVRQVSALLFTLLVIAMILLYTGILHLPVSLPMVPPQAVTVSHTSSCVSTATAKTAQPFNETFQDNQRGWQQDPVDAITPKIEGSAYKLSVAKSENVYFLCPNTANVGTLPANFTLTARIAQQQGPPTAYYGLAFRLTQNGNNVFTYVFAINGNGACALFKYGQNKATAIQSLSSEPAISKNGPNTLQVGVQGSHFLFKINDAPVSFASAPSDTAYTGGELGLMVSGPDTTFAVTSVQLSIP